MDINIKGDPGTGNSFTEIKIENGGIYQNLPNVTTVNNTTNIYGDGKAAARTGGDIDDKEKQILKTAILQFVGKLKEKVTKEWLDDYDTLWVSVLAIPEVDAAIYKKGNQQNIHFNRQLVGSIVRVMLDKGVFVSTTNPTELAPLIGVGSGSFRKEMGKYPSDEIVKAVKELIEKK